MSKPKVQARKRTQAPPAPKERRPPLEIVLAELLREPRTSAGFALMVRDHFASAADQHERAAQAHRVAGVAEIVHAGLSTLNRYAERKAVKK